MKANGIGKRFLIFTLIVVIVLTIQRPRVLAESLQPEDKPETSTEQQENQPETTEGQSVSQNDLAEEESESQPETTVEQSVSENDLSELPLENQPVVAAEQPDAAAEYPELTDDILNKCILPGMNPPGVTVNLFDYWQDDNNERGEIAHDQEIGVLWRTYNIGISRGHLLRFGYRDVYCKYCQSDEGDFGEWNNSKTNELYTGIVKNRLGAYGFPVLNFNTIVDISKFGRYADSGNEEYLSKKEESLAYLFSPSVRLPDYKESYIDVQGLFQSSPDGDGYYFYNSTDNFASYNRATNSFILYNSPGVAEDGANEKSCGQFFPFNTAEEVFDTYTDDNGKYHLCYMNKEDSIRIKDNSYLQCTADILNHYLGMTMEFLFEQPENGCLSNGNPMTFEFSGDDDVWIFIDGVLVADLGGLHNACSLDINFSTGNVNVVGKPHTLLDSFKDAYGEDSNLGGIAFNENTFADNTLHTLKMFYLERGHAASDLDLKFNIQTIPYEPITEEHSNVPNEDTDENEEPASDPAQENMSEAEESIISVSDNHMVLDTTGIPRTGDDSMIGWLSALCIISLLGIGATACNLIIKRRKEDNHSSKQ